MEFQLTDTIKIPAVGFGTYLISDGDVENPVYFAVQTGYRHIDTAEAYGNERGVGQGIGKAMRELDITREDLFVTTKLWPGNADWGQEPKTYDGTIDSLNASLERLQLDYVDLYLIHAPFPKEQRLEQWRALVDLKHMGKAKAVGVSNYNESHIEEIRASGMPLPDANQIELHPWSQKPELVSYLRDKGITIIAYSSLIPLSSWRVEPGQDSAKSDAMRQEGERADAPFKIMAEKYGVTEAQLLLRWGIQKGYVILPKSTNEKRIQQNFDLFSFEIDDDDMADIETMDRGGGIAWSAGDPLQAS